MESEIKDMKKEILKLAVDVALIKNILISEGELTESAKKDLDEARAENPKEYLSLEEL